MPRVAASVTRPPSSRRPHLCRVPDLTSAGFGASHVRLGRTAYAPDARGAPQTPGMVARARRVPTGASGLVPGPHLTPIGFGARSVRLGRTAYAPDARGAPQTREWLREPGGSRPGQAGWWTVLSPDYRIRNSDVRPLSGSEGAVRSGNAAQLRFPDPRASDGCLAPRHPSSAPVPAPTSPLPGLGRTTPSRGAARTPRTRAARPKPGVNARGAPQTREEGRPRTGASGGGKPAR